ALKHPELFCSAVSHSGALARGHHPVKPDPDNPFTTETIRIFGEHPEGGPEDIFALAERLDPTHHPTLRIDSGTGDSILQDNRALQAHLDRTGYPHESLAAPGQHEWAYWDLHVQEAIRFHARNLRLRKQASRGRDVSKRE